MTPPPYPRIPHLWPGGGTADDKVLSPEEAEGFLHRPLVAEEKLDGANVMLWLDEGSVRCATRGGADTMDRAGQLGPLRAWVAERVGPLQALLADHAAVYCEWLLLTHTLAYDRLPSYLVVLDLLETGGSFASVDDRDSRCVDAGLAVPPELFRGVLESGRAVERLLGPSRWSAGDAEGLVLRALDGHDPLLAKVLRPGFETIDDADWGRERPRNRLIDAEVSWH